MTPLGNVYSRLNKSLSNRLGETWTHIPMSENSNPNCIPSEDPDRNEQCFKGIYKRPSMRDLVKDARDFHVGVQTVQSYIEVFNCNIDFYQGDYVENSSGVKYQIRSVESLERGSFKLVLSYGGADV